MNSVEFYIELLKVFGNINKESFKKILNIIIKYTKTEKIILSYHQNKYLYFGKDNIVDDVFISNIINIDDMTINLINSERYLSSEEIRYLVEIFKINKELLNRIYMDMTYNVMNNNAFEENISYVDTISNLGIAYIDINGLKEINDTMGHLVGDEKIMYTIKLMKKYFRAQDIYRIHGDEIVILCNMKRELFIKKIEDLHNEYKENGFASLGWTYVDYRKKINPEDDLIKTILKEAEEFMYKEKNEFYERTSKCRSKIKSEM